MTTTEDVHEIRCSAKHNVGFYVRAGKQFLLGTRGKDGTPGKSGVDVIQMSGLGSAISTCVGAVGRITSSKIATITKIETGYPLMSSKGEEGEQPRGVALVKVTLKVNPESRLQTHEEEAPEQ